MSNEDFARRFGLDGGEFFITAPAPCPYLKGKRERKIFSYLSGDGASSTNALLTRRGFRRSQNLIYLPACEACNACVPVRVVVDDFDLTVLDYASMIEETAVDTIIIEYRIRDDDTGEERLIGAALTDRLTDGLSMVYSFFEPEEEARSLGRFMILDHVSFARELGLPYVYLGYWVNGSDKMDYKKTFQPLEMLGPNGWTRMDRQTPPREAAEAAF